MSVCFIIQREGDMADILTDYEKLIKEYNILSSYPLGDFDSAGKYTISTTIFEDLISCKKLITVYKLDHMEAEAKFKDFTLNFYIKIEEDTLKEIKYASLYLVENIKIGAEKINQQTFIVKFHDYDDFDYLDKLKNIFNLYTNEGDGKDIVNSFPAIEKIILDKKILVKSLINELGNDNRQYVIAVLSLLKQSGEFGLQLQKLFKDTIAKITIDKKSVAYWNAVKNELDKILTENKNKANKEFLEKLEKINQTYILLYGQKKKKILQNKVKVDSQSKKKSGKAKADDGGDSKNGGGRSKNKPEQKASESKKSDKEEEKKSSLNSLIGKCKIEISKLNEKGQNPFRALQMREKEGYVFNNDSSTKEYFSGNGESLTFTFSSAYYDKTVISSVSQQNESSVKYSSIKSFEAINETSSSLHQKTDDDELVK